MSEQENILIRPVREIKNYSTGEIETHVMSNKEKTQLSRYLNKYFRNYWQMYKGGGKGDE